MVVNEDAGKTIILVVLAIIVNPLIIITVRCLVFVLVVLINLLEKEEV